MPEACKMGRMDEVRFLLLQGADVNAKNKVRLFVAESESNPTLFVQWSCTAPSTNLSTILTNFLISKT